jgi:hypothetical protein
MQVRPVLTIHADIGRIAVPALNISDASSAECSVCNSGGTNRNLEDDSDEACGCTRLLIEREFAPSA